MDKLSQEKSDARQKALDVETAKNTARAESLKKKEEEAIAAAKAAEAPAEEEASAEAAPDAETPEANEENQA